MTRIAGMLALLTNDGPYARGVSLAFVVLLAIVLVLRPAARADGASVADRLALALALIGMIGGITHGIGHQSERWLLRRAAQPWIAWITMAVGGAWLSWPEF